MTDQEIDKIFENEDVLRRAQIIRQYGETTIVFRMLTLMLREYTKQSNLAEIQIHWTREDGFKKSEISFC